MTMLNVNLTEILCCPETHQPVKAASDEFVSQLNAQIAAGQLRKQSGDAVDEKVETALIREDGRMVYPIRNGIPVMLIDEAIAVAAPPA